MTGKASGEEYTITQFRIRRIIITDTRQIVNVYVYVNVNLNVHVDSVLKHIDNIWT